MRALKMSVAIVSSFIVCWTPYYLLGLWYWFFPDDMGETVSHSLTHILFIFGLFNACLDPITYGLFTIHFRKGLKRYCGGAAVLNESENNSTMTGSFKCSPSPFRMKKLAQSSPAGRRPQKIEGQQCKKQEPHNNYLTVYQNTEPGDPNQSSPDSGYWFLLNATLAYYFWGETKSERIFAYSSSQISCCLSQAVNNTRNCDGNTVLFTCPYWQCCSEWIVLIFL